MKTWLHILKVKNYYFYLHTPRLQVGRSTTSSSHEHRTSNSSSSLILSIQSLSILHFHPPNQRNQPSELTPFTTTHFNNAPPTIYPHPPPHHNHTRLHTSAPTFFPLCRSIRPSCRHTNNQEQINIDNEKRQGQRSPADAISICSGSRNGVVQKADGWKSVVRERWVAGLQFVC